MFNPNKYEKYNEVEDYDEKIKLVRKDVNNYPKIHIAPPCGLLNDPNGLVYFNDEYHIFYQFHPNKVKHGLKNWYHLTTKDFINFKARGIKLYPEEDFENFGIFSGSAIVVGDYLEIYYTANYRDPNDNYRRIPKQVKAIMNAEYEIISKHIVFDLPSKYTEHYRDPAPIGNNSFLIGAQNKAEKKGCLSLVESWSDERTLSFSNELEMAYMIECPNYVKVEEEEFIIMSPQGMSGDKYPSPNQSVYIKSGLVKDNISEEVFLLDYGFDFYAPQIFQNTDRKLMIGWLGLPDTIYPFEVENGWSQCLTLVRELSSHNGKLYQYPITEYSRLRKKCENITAGKKVNTTRTYEVELSMENGDSVTIGNNSNIQLSYTDGILYLDRSNLLENINVEYGSIRSVAIGQSKIIVNIFVDHSTLEVYINKGEYVLSSRIFVDEVQSLQCTTFAQLYNLSKINIEEYYV